jgi:hypothetical protein
VAPKKRKKRSARAKDPLATYRRIRKPMPPPERVIGDKRRRLQEERSRREIDEAGER